ncbi:MAG: sorbosone dehydrogenase family protein [Gammaproteobacteria bacterium]|nr:sorbosone dehydrogenase family protein [Gammaproteobacteria bacterium]
MLRAIMVLSLALMGALWDTQALKSLYSKERSPMNQPGRRLWRKVAYGIGAVIALLAGVVIWFVFLGGVALTDRAMLWRMIRGIEAEPPAATEVSRLLTVPEGFEISLWATGLPSARILTPLPTGDLLLTQPRGGLVTWLQADRDGDGRSDGQQVLRANLDRPNGIDYHEGWLYIAEATRVVRFRFDPEQPALGEPEVLIDGLTADGGHWRKTVRVGPDGKLYLGQGSTCNVCLEADPRRATVMRFTLEGEEGVLVASGTRNPYGFDWTPWDQRLYATENGRDLLGDDLPPDELNHIIEGGFYGWPHVHGKDIKDPKWAEGYAERIAAALPPAHEFGAHVAPLGIRFLRHPERAAAHARTALVALHGSWNRSTPSGYEVVALHFDDRGEISEQTFVAGFRQPDQLIGRPVDVAEGADGTIYITDDYAGAVYQVRASGVPSTDPD